MKKLFPTTRWFWLFVSLHLTVWTVIPAWLRFNLPMDAIEGALWGKQLALGYDKNPFLNAWLTRLAMYLSNYQDWMIYLFSQIAVVIGFWAIWQLARKFLSPVHALLPVFLLETISSYNLDAIDFDDNILELGLWSLLILYFYKAIRAQGWRDWALVGIFAGFALMTKYYVIVLFIPMFLFLLVNPAARISFQKKGLYLACFICLLISAPHFIWLFGHHFITIQYAFARVGKSCGFLTHLIYPYKFAMPFLEALILPILLFATLYIGKNETNVISTRTTITKNQWEFLIWMGFGPFAVTILLSLLFGFSLNAGWSMPLFALLGIMLVAKFQPIITKIKFYRFMIILFLLLGIALNGYSYALLKAKNTSSANYPGRKIVERITQLWHDQYHTPLAYVIGPRWEAGNVAYYSPDKPTVYIRGNAVISFWIDQKDLYQKGGILIWKAHDDFEKQFNHAFLTWLKNQYSDYPKPKMLIIPWMRSQNTKSVKLNIAFLPSKVTKKLP